MQPRADHRLEILEEAALVVFGQPQRLPCFRHASAFPRFQVEKRRVHRRQFLGVTDGFFRFLPFSPAEITQRLGGACGSRMISGS